MGEKEKGKVHNIREKESHYWQNNTYFYSSLLERDRDRESKLRKREWEKKRERERNESVWVLNKLSKYSVAKLGQLWGAQWLFSKGYDRHSHGYISWDKKKSKCW